MRTLAVTWETVHQHGEAWISHHRLRYKMFVERQKWTIPTYRQMEYDEFDTPAATYILTVDDQYRALGAARLKRVLRAPYLRRDLELQGAGGGENGPRLQIEECAPS
jgi:N-acyl-L-homoserine lactone synthetase